VCGEGHEGGLELALAVTCACCVDEHEQQYRGDREDKDAQAAESAPVRGRMHHHQGHEDGCVRQLEQATTAEQDDSTSIMQSSESLHSVCFKFFCPPSSEFSWRASLTSLRREEGRRTGWTSAMDGG
jgi:hypothetical protein